MIVVSLGSNLSSSFGDRFHNIDRAISLLLKHDIKLVKKSSFYETPSYPNKKQPKFINVVIAILTTMNPQEFASLLISIEEKIERTRNKKNDPRTCDIDIIDFNGEILDFYYKNLNFTVPHERTKERSFVLYPLKEILPDWKHPQTNESINFLIQKLDSEKKKSILKL